MKQRLVILSDLWGKVNSEWIKNYIKLLEANFDIKYYDSCDLGKINTTISTQNNLHQQFINGGIEIAVEGLLKKEKESVYVLAFSIGGAIAWKAGLKGLKIEEMFVVSSTRLRYETKKPNCNIHLFFGEEDIYKPKDYWFKELNLGEYLVKNKGHELYLEEKCKNMICKEINNYTT